MIKGIKFDTPVISASGCWAATEEQIDELLKTDISGVVMKTCTYHPNKGNKNPIYIKDGDITYNNMGCPNLGFDYYLDIYKKNKSKPLIFSILGSDIMLREMLIETTGAMVEVNMSCKNIDTNYNLKEVLGFITPEMIVGVKLTPYFDKDQIKEVCEILNNSNITFITCCNSIPTFDGCSISGKANKHISIGNIREFRKYLNPEIIIMASGGVDDGLEHLQAGADMVQRGSLFYS